MRRTAMGQNLNLESKEPLAQVADKLVGSTVNLMRTAKTEEDLRIGFEKTLEPLCLSIGVESHPKYEKSIYKSGRADALHGQVIIEYERPGAFRTPKQVDHACDQLVDYIKGEAKERKETLFLLDPKLVGVGFDGEQIFFVQYHGDKTKLKTRLDRRDFKLIGPYPFNAQSARTFLTYVRALSRRLLTAENLAEVFGPKSKLAPQMVSALADALENWDSTGRARTFFNEWRRLFGIVYGEQFNTHQAKEVQKLSELYQVSKETDFQELLFSVHTYFVFLMKLISAELLSIAETSFKSSFSDDLVHSDKKTSLNKLNYVEDGGIYAKRGITNFLEGDFFRWYLDAFSPRVEEAIREVARAFSDFEPATTALNSKSNRDLLKKLYQYLVPQEVRHKLGEYYTPDWLAELVLNEVGYEGNTLKRLLDPACGSGTFLVLAIQRAREYGQGQKEPPLETAKRIVANIWGFDLNPLAVIASRTNYLFALGDLVEQLQSFEIPIYLADSVLWPERSGQMQLGPRGESIEIPTSIQTFFVPKIWVTNRGFLMKIAAPLVEKMAKEQYSISEAMKRFKKAGLIFHPHEEVVENFYNEIVELEKQGKNGIWARFLKNAFAPMVAGQFHFVVGNPPWIRWDYLSQDYRKATLHLWKDYGLFSLKGFETRLGGAKKDFSMLFTYAASDYYLEPGGKLGFLITQEVFKSKGAGEGFRRFKLGEQGKFLKVMKAHDLVSIQPFEGAANKTAAIVLKKGQKTSYPVFYFVWQRKKGVGKIPTHMTLDEVKPLLEKRRLSGQPIGSDVSAWQTVARGDEDLASIQGKNYYKAHSGAYTSPYGVFWVSLEQVLSDGNMIVSNLPEKGDRAIPAVRETIESDLLFPAIRGSDVRRWSAVPHLYVLITQDPQKRVGYNEMVMKKKWPRTYGYLVRFREFLVTQAAYKKYHAESNNPFYSQYNVADYTFSRYRVIWKQMTNDLIAAVVSQTKTPAGFKTTVPLHTTALIACDNEDEAHYLCCIINSTPVREFIKSFSSAGRGFGTPSVMGHVGIPKFSPKNRLHSKLAELSKTLHDLAAKNKLEEVGWLEPEVDLWVSKLFGITKEIS